MPTIRTPPGETPPDFPTEKAHSVLSAQLAKLQQLKGKDHQDVKPAEDEWFNLTAKLVMRSFGSGSPNYSTFRRGHRAGDYYVRPFGGGEDDELAQRNFETRLEAYEGALRSCLAELELDLPDAEIKGVYQPGEEYEFYRDVKACLGLAQKEICD